MSIELTRTQAKVVTGRSDGLRLITYQSLWSPSGVLFNQGLCAISVNFVSLLANKLFPGSTVLIIFLKNKTHFLKRGLAHTKHSFPIFDVEYQVIFY